MVTEVVADRDWWMMSDDMGPVSPPETDHIGQCHDLIHTDH